MKRIIVVKHRPRPARVWHPTHITDPGPAETRYESALAAIESDDSLKRAIERAQLRATRLA